jgi:ADP-ribose pyrophosphatase YjhB (NUDIX family)
LPLRITAYEGESDLPDDLVLSVRCFVLVGDSLVICTNADGSSHPWPGGRREPGESIAETARREVHEETGWRLELDSLKALGWLHFERLVDEADPKYPHPDFLQLVYVGTATARDETQGEAWSDIDGYELSSRLVARQEALTLMDHGNVAVEFLKRI